MARTLARPGGHPPAPGRRHTGRPLPASTLGWNSGKEPQGQERRCGRGSSRCAWGGASPVPLPSWSPGVSAPWGPRPAEPPGSCAESPSPSSAQLSVGDGRGAGRWGRGDICHHQPACPAGPPALLCLQSWSPHNAFSEGPVSRGPRPASLSTCIPPPAGVPLWDSLGAHPPPAVPLCPLRTGLREGLRAQAPPSPEGPALSRGF